MVDLYQHPTSGDYYLLDTDENGCTIDVCGPLTRDQLEAVNNPLADGDEYNDMEWNPSDSEWADSVKGWRAVGHSELRKRLDTPTIMGGIS